MVNSFLNRLFNLLVASVLLVGLSPLFLLVSLLIVLDSPGSPIFIQKRVGKNKKIFQMYKFRTMYLGAESKQSELAENSVSDGPVFKVESDPRITRIGAFLRVGFDELPQLWNVLKGEMDLVGPRPFPVFEALKIPNKYDFRYLVNPGITGLASLDSKRHSNFSKWMMADVDYMRRKSIFWDLDVIVKSIEYILKN